MDVSVKNSAFSSIASQIDLKVTAFNNKVRGESSGT